MAGGVVTPNFPQEYWPKCISSGCQRVLLPFCYPRAAVRNSFPAQPCFLLREMLTFLDKAFPPMRSRTTVTRQLRLGDWKDSELMLFKCVGFDLWRHLNVFLLHRRTLFWLEAPCPSLTSSRSKVWLISLRRHQPQKLATPRVSSKGI